MGQDTRRAPSSDQHTGVSLCMPPATPGCMLYTVCCVSLVYSLPVPAHTLAAKPSALLPQILVLMTDSADISQMCACAFAGPCASCASGSFSVWGRQQSSRAPDRHSTAAAGHICEPHQSSYCTCARAGPPGWVSCRAASRSCGQLWQHITSAALLPA